MAEKIFTTEGPEVAMGEGLPQMVQQLLSLDGVEGYNKPIKPRHVDEIFEIEVDLRALQIPMRRFHGQASSWLEAKSGGIMRYNTRHLLGEMTLKQIAGFPESEEIQFYIPSGRRDSLLPDYKALLLKGVARTTGIIFRYSDRPVESVGLTLVRGGRRCEPSELRYLSKSRDTSYPLQRVLDNMRGSVPLKLERKQLY